MHRTWLFDTNETSSIVSNSSESSLHPVYGVFDVLMWILTSLFYILFIAIAVRVFQLVVREKQRWSVSLAVHLLLLIPTLARALDMSFFHEGYLITSFQDQTTAEMFVGSIPGYTFFSTYSLLFCFWIVLYRNALLPTTLGRRSNDSQHLRILYGVVNGIIYIIWFTLEIVMACTNGTTRTNLHMGEVFFAATLNIVSAIVFWISGHCVASRIRNMAESPKPTTPRGGSSSSVNNITLPKSNKGLGIAKKIWRLTILFTSVLAVRSVIIIVDWFIPPGYSFSALIATFTLRVVFQAVCELVPSIITITVLAKSIVSDQPKPHVRDRERDPLI